MSIDHAMIREIIRIARRRLSRELTPSEMEVLSEQRGLRDYEAIIETISSEGASPDEIEAYLRLLTRQ